MKVKETILLVILTIFLVITTPNNAFSASYSTNLDKNAYYTILYSTNGGDPQRLNNVIVVGTKVIANKLFLSVQIETDASSSRVKQVYVAVDSIILITKQ